MDYFFLNFKNILLKEFISTPGEVLVCNSVHNTFTSIVFSANPRAAAELNANHHASQECSTQRDNNRFPPLFIAICCIHVYMEVLLV